ncbi:MAG: hypothetical protein LN568_03495 [Rickettsia endosymbiont of Pseudomimeciton antennatum]|nr:hypothetical protein [Rickettsia endosymbiont of Pseudomimeciton antennatum]
MKTKRVNLPSSPKDQQKIDNYLTDTYNQKGRFTNLQGVYEESRKAEESEEYKTDPKFRDAVTFTQPNEAWSFFLYLAIGQKEAAYYLAMSFIDGLGAKQDESLAYLSMAIGVKLGDKKSIELVGRESIPDNIKKLANECVKQINKNAVGKKEITYEDAIGRAKVLDHMVKTKLDVSFGENILPGSIKGYAKFVEVVGIPYYEMDVCGASTSGHNTSGDSGLHDISFDELKDVVMGGESSHHYHHHH